MKAYTPILLAAAVAAVSTFAQADDMSLWNDGATKTQIIHFVKEATNKQSDHYIAPERRIAVFDNDGTLWTEKPLYTHFFAVIQQIKSQLAADPSLASRQPWKTFATAKPDLSYLSQLMSTESFGINSLADSLFATPFAGMSQAQYTKEMSQFLENWKHPRFKTRVDKLIYAPMKEMISYLQDNDFQVYIYTADEAQFLKPLAEKLYGIPASHVFGTSVSTTYTVENGKTVMTRGGQVDWINNWAHKPELIAKTFGDVVPVMAFGNSNGDAEMLDYVAKNGGLAMWVHHTDGKREYAYDKHTDRLAKLTKSKEIFPIDMKTTWKAVFPK